MQADEVPQLLEATCEVIMTEVKAPAPVVPALCKQTMGGTGLTKGAPVFPPLPPPPLLPPPTCRDTDNTLSDLIARVQALTQSSPKKRPRPRQAKQSQVSATAATAKSTGSGSSGNDAASLCVDAPWRRPARKF